MKINKDIPNFDSNYSKVLKKYYDNELSQFERNELEKAAMLDPFLKDAMEGFDENPGSFEKFYKRNERRLTEKKNYTFFIAIIGLAILFFITTLIQLNTESNYNETVINDLKIEKEATHPKKLLETIEETEAIEEIEIIPEEIKELEVIPVAETITIEEVKINQQRGNAINKETAEEAIIIDEDIDIEQEYTLLNEELNLNNDDSNILKTIYLFDLKVVDYRSIQRERNSISYSRFELGGTSANMENDSVETELIERVVEIPYQNYLSKSMSFFAKSRYKQALSRYLVILVQYPEDLNALFYGGLCYYNLGKFDKSILFFDQIIDKQQGNFDEESLWYKAKSLIKLRNTPQAKTVLDKIIYKGGFYVEDAISLRKSLE